jgi:hypothetical protein
MMKFETYDTIQGVTVQQDDQVPWMFYFLPGAPRYRLDDRGMPVFRYIKYREPKPRPDGKNGGGFLMFDCAFSIPQATQDAVRSILQDRINQQFSNAPSKPTVEIGSISWTRGVASLNLSQISSNFVEKYENPASPQLYGDLITPFTIELTQEGATLFEAILQGGEGSAQVSYQIWCWTAMPPIHAIAWFHAEAFYSYWQSIDVSENIWGEDSYQNTIREQFRNSQCEGVHIDPAPGVDPKVVTEIADNLQKSLEAEIQKALNDSVIQGVTGDDRNRVDHFDHTGRDIQISKITDIQHSYDQGVAFEWNPNPQGTLPNIETLKGPDGKPLQWKDFSIDVDLNDPFFQTLDVTILVNADFVNMPIFSVDVTLEHPGTQPQTYSFRSANDVNKFSAFLGNNPAKYKYRYTVHYKDESKTFQSPDIGTDQTVITLDIDSVGVLAVDIVPGNLRWTQMSTVQVTLHYEDAANGVQPIEQTFTLTQDKPTARFEQLIFQPMQNPYKYKVLYLLSSGQQYQVDWVETRLPQLFINAPFTNSETVVVRAFGDLDNTIKTIFVDLKYIDAANGDYTQTNSVALSSQVPFVTWSFPIISQTAGELTYSGTIVRADGTETPIVQATATNTTIDVGDLFDHKVEIVPDLIDWSTVQLVEVDISYKNNPVQQLIFKSNATESQYSFLHADANDPAFAYQWQATYYLKDGSQKSTASTTSSKLTVILPPRIS